MWKIRDDVGFELTTNGSSQPRGTTLHKKSTSQSAQLNLFFKNDSANTRITFMNHTCVSDPESELCPWHSTFTRGALFLFPSGTGTAAGAGASTSILTAASSLPLLTTSVLWPLRDFTGSTGGGGGYKRKIETIQLQFSFSERDCGHIYSHAFKLSTTYTELPWCVVW